MAFLNNRKFAEIKEAAKNGNEKAAMILQAMLKNSPQGDLDNLVNDYYNVINDVPPIEQIEDQPEIVEADVEPAMDLDTGFEDVEPIETEEVPSIVDLSASLDAEMDGLLDEEELEQFSFSDFLSNKRRDTLRGRKNADYFKVFDAVGRNNYADNKIASYGQKFDGNRRDIEREYNDFNKSIDNYSNSLSYMLDDEAALDTEQAGLAYDELTGNENAMKSFGRHWDEQDNQSMQEILQELVVKYGKKNVMAVLNTLKSDNENYKNFKNNQIDTEISRYSKNIEKLLR